MSVPDVSKPGLVLRVLRYLSQLLKSIWVFFPGILFLFATALIFWTLGQGKDFIVAFTENHSQQFYFVYYTRIVFFMAIGFWVYVSWYSSRIIAYLKKGKEEDIIKSITGEGDQKWHALKNKNLYEISEGFLDEFPRVIGNGCCLVLELAVLQSPLSPWPISSGVAWLLLFAALIGHYYLNRILRIKFSEKPWFRKIFHGLLIALIILVLFASGTWFQKIHILNLFGLLLLFHAVFIFYINLRRVRMEKHAAHNSIEPEERTSVLYKVMKYFCVPYKESGYFRWFLYLGIAGLLFYFLSINWLMFARGIGPFAFIILGFAVALAFGNIVTAFSIRYKVNFHFLLLILAFGLGMKETHYIRTVDMPVDNGYTNRPELKEYLVKWLDSRKELNDTAKDYDIFFVMANGGASRSGYWTASVLGELEDSSLTNQNYRFSDHIFCLSGTSGGGVGVATFFSLLKDKEQKTAPVFRTSAEQYLRKDYFTFTFARLLGPDFFNYIFHIPFVADRAGALEMSFEESAKKYDSNTYKIPFDGNMSDFPALKNGTVYLPILCVNTTRMQDGNPGVVTNIKLNPETFNSRVDVLSLLPKDKDITLTTSSIMGARFPYLSPAGRIADSYFVDGGYFDNSGAGVVQEIIRGILDVAKRDSITNGGGGSIYKKVSKLHFKVLHITNSPVSSKANNIKGVAPIKNDLMAPILTIVGAYGMQTTVNDSRLMNYIKDINDFSVNKANYLHIPLYLEQSEKVKDTTGKYLPESEYAMNWFISDTTVHRMNQRLKEQPRLDSLIKAIQALK